MDDPYMPVSMDTESYKPMTPSLLFQKLSELKMEREHLTCNVEEVDLSSVMKESFTPLSVSPDMGMNDQAGLATLDPLYTGSDDGDRTLVDEDELTTVLSMSCDKQLAWPTDLDEQNDDDSESEIMAHDLSPPPDAPIAEQVRWQVVRVVHRAMDTLTLDIPQALEESRLGNAALQIVRLPATVTTESAVVKALRSRFETAIQGRLVRHVQSQYTRARCIVISTMDHEVSEIYDQSNLLSDNVQVISAHIDSLQARLEALVIQKIKLIIETMMRYVSEVIPNEFDRLLQRFMLADGALMRPIYDRIHGHLIPLVAAIVAALTTALLRHADWVNRAVIRKIGEDFKGIRQQFTY